MLVVGAGPIGLLGALIAVQHGVEVHVLDRVESGPKPALVKELAATYHTGSVADVGLRPDIVLECSGAARLVQQSIACVSPGGIVCLTAPRLAVGAEPRPPLPLRLLAAVPGLGRAGRSTAPARTLAVPTPIPAS